MFQSTPSGSRTDLISSIFDDDSAANGNCLRNIKKNAANYKKFELPYNPSLYDSDSPVTDIDSLHISNNMRCLESSTQM